MAYVLATGTIIKRKTFPKRYFQGVPGADTWFEMEFQLNGTLITRQERGAELTQTLDDMGGLSYDTTLYEDTAANKVAFRFYKKVGNKTYDVWMEYDFSVYIDKVKIRIHGELPSTGHIKLKHIFKTLKRIDSKPNCISDIVTFGDSYIDSGSSSSTYDFTDILTNATASWVDADDVLDITVPAVFDIDPVQQGTLAHTDPSNGHKVVRTSDGTIHTVNGEDWFYSTNGGTSWNRILIATNCDSATIAKDSNDNLFICYIRHDSRVLACKKLTVTKGGPPWSWTPSSENLIGSNTDNYYPDICITSGGYIHVTCERTGGAVTWAYCTNGDGNSWTVSSATGSSSYQISTICCDSSQNIFILYSSTGGGTTYVVKATYSSGPSWSMGSASSITLPANSKEGIIDCDSNDKINLVTCKQSSTYAIYFTQTTNASDITSWITAETIQSASVYNSALSFSFYPSDTTKVRAYFVCTDENSSGDIYYKDRISGTWGSRTRVTNTSTSYTHNKVYSCTKPTGTISDFTYLEGYSGTTYSYWNYFEIVSNIIKLYPTYLLVGTVSENVLYGSIKMKSDGELQIPELIEDSAGITMKIYSDRMKVKEIKEG